MWKSRFLAFKMSFTDIFNSRDDDAKGRTIQLFCNLMASFYNVFITGIFYTGFLTMYGISITGAGIVTFIPPIASVFSIFSSKILSRFKRRKPILIAAKIYFYAMYILATNIMPQFVTDPDARLMWFVVILFLAYAIYAPFSPGFTVWFYRFFPEENHRRTRYLSYLQIFSSAMSALILLISSVITDAVSGSPYQATIILALRYLAFVLVIIEIVVQVRAKEYPAEEESKPSLKQIFAVPLRHRKFMACMLLQFAWNYIANLHNGLWNYYLLNHMNFSYTLINVMSSLYTVFLITLTSPWQKVLRRYSWIKTFGIACLMLVPTELFFFMMTPDRPWIYVPMVIVQHIVSVGLNLSYANILYTNLPKENSTSCIAFNTIGCNLFAFLGLITGTAISGISGDSTMPFMGMEVYSVQFTLLLRAVTIFAMGYILCKYWRVFTRDDEIEEVERDARVRRELKAKKLNRGRYRWKLPKLIGK